VTFEGQRRFDYLNGNLYSYHPDALGTVRLVTMQDVSVSGDNVLYPWGQSWTYSGSSTNLFAGFQNWDGNVGAPMYPGQFRVYPVNYGRWLTPDPSGKKAVRLDDPQTWNAYAYVRNNPTTLTDPSGLLTPAGGVDPFESTHVYTGTIESIDQGTEERPAGEKAQQQVSQQGIDFIKSWEGWNGTLDEATGLSLPKDDGFGNGTIGWGHNCGKCEDFAGGMTKSQGDDLLQSDLVVLEKSVSRITGRKATQQQFDALVAFAFNVRNYQSSTLMHNVASGVPVTEAHFTAYGHARNSQGILVSVPSLLRRRESEWDVYASGVYNSSH